MKRVVLKKEKKLTDKSNLDNALFRDVDGPHDDRWADAIWASMQKGIVKEGKKTIEIDAANADWMHKLPGYADELKLHDDLGGKHDTSNSNNI
jgi:hypothetical protein